MKNKRNELEVSFFLQLADLNIHIDQLSLKFLLRFFKIKIDSIKRESSVSEEMITSDKNANLNDNHSHNHSVTISQINAEHIHTMNHHDKEDPMSKVVFKLFSRRFIVQEFSINFCYNAQKLTFENLKEKELLECLNISSINDLKLEFTTFDFKERKFLLDVIKESFDFWKDDILKRQIVNAYLGSISLIRPFKNIVGGFVDIFKQPYNNYIEDRSIKEGISKGMKNFIVSFSTETLIMGEKVICIY
jgi:hypothetical protein